MRPRRYETGTQPDAADCAARRPACGRAARSGALARTCGLRAAATSAAVTRSAAWVSAAIHSASNGFARPSFAHERGSHFPSPAIANRDARTRIDRAASRVETSTRYGEPSSAARTAQRRTQALADLRERHALRRRDAKLVAEHANLVVVLERHDRQSGEVAEQCRVQAHRDDGIAGRDQRCGFVDAHALPYGMRASVRELRYQAIRDFAALDGVWICRRRAGEIEPQAAPSRGKAHRGTPLRSPPPIRDRTASRAPRSPSPAAPPARGTVPQDQSRAREA